MKRIPLKKGEKVTSNYTYIIDGVLGSGASCIVYDAHFIDSHGNKKEVKLKECYPYDLSVKRAGNTLVWSKEEEKNTTLAKFKESYDLLSDMQNEEEIKDAAVYTLDMFDCNETKYIATIPSVGTSYDKCKNDDIVDIVTTCLALTNAVGNLHGLGYLHMDIKPENFIAVSDHTNKGKNVVFFDMDTFISFDEINNNTLKGVSYSEDWAAPEVKSRRFNKLCPATDIFSIGVVLFERILKRMPYCLDSMSYAEWTFDERFAPGKVSPEAQRLLSEIFHKTLASSIKKRYQSTDELSKALYELLKVINKKNYIISSFPTNTCTFVGRETEIAELHKGIKDTGKVFVSGFGGIGKSEIVKKYINIYGKDYDSISFVRYTGSLIDDLKDIIIKDVVDTQDRMKVLAGLCSERNLIILDNFDVATNKAKNLEALLRLNCSLIVTTRTDFSHVFPDLSFIKIYGLPDSELFRIYENESSNKLSEEDKSVLTPLLALGKECTFFWSFFSRLVKIGGYAIKDIVQTVLGGLKNLDNSEKILVAKDNIGIDKNITVAMRSLFKFHKLPKTQIEMLYFVRTFSVLDLKRISLAESFDQIDKSKKPKRMVALNKLIELGLINEDDLIYMNDVLKDVIDAEFDLINTDLDDNDAEDDDIDAEVEIIDPVFIVSCFKIDLIDKFMKIEFKNKFEEHVKFFSLYSQARSFCSYLCERIITIFENCNFNDNYSCEYLVSLIFDMVKTNKKTVSVLQREKSSRVIDILNKSIEKSEIDETVKIKALMILSIVYSNLSVVSLFELANQEHYDAMKLCEETLNHLISLINNHSANTEMMDCFRSIEINNFGTVSEIIGQNPIKNYIFDFSSFYNELLNFDFDDEFESEDTISNEKMIEALSSENGIDSNEASDIISNFSSFYNEEFYEPTRFDFDDEFELEDTIKMIDALSSDSGIGSDEKFELISSFSSYAHFSKDLTKVKELADKIYEKLFKNVGITYLNRHNYIEILAALVVSNLNNDGDLEKSMDDLYKVSADNIADAVIPEELCRNMFEIFGDTDFWLTIETLQFRLKEEFAFKYEVLYTVKMEEKVFHEGWNKIILYDFYKKLSDDSKVISEKEDLPPEEKEKYKKISLDYQKKADDALGKKY